MAHQPEGKLVQAIKAHAKSRGARPFKIVASEDSFQEVGIPDLLMCFLGRFVGAEVKQPGAKLRPAQRAVLNEIYRAGGVAAVLETVGQAAELLSHIEKESVRAKTRPICYDRGRISNVCRFSN
jgi:hypothetical protein